MRNFKWGISRVLMEADKTPLVIPIWLSGKSLSLSFLSQALTLEYCSALGFDQVASEARTFPRFLPRWGKEVSVVIGEPLNARLAPLLAEHSQRFPVPWRPVSYGNDVAEDLLKEPEGLAELRSRLAEEIRKELLALGRGDRPPPA